MTNSLIPYSFEPGTKARAQEVNANFLSLADEIQNNKTYFDTKVEEINEAAAATDSSIDETNTKLTEKLNHSQITNCILEAPNGVAEYLGNEITVKKGLKVLIPDGLNADGTLKNIEYTVEEDIVLDLTGTTAATKYFFLTSDGEIIVNECLGYYEQPNDPVNYTVVTTNYAWLDTTNNKYKFSINSGTNWTEKSCCLLGMYTYDATNFTAFKTYKLLSFLKESSFAEYGRLFMPDFTKSIGVGQNADRYAEKNYWLFIKAAHTGSQSNTQVFIDGVKVFHNEENMNYNNWNDNSFIPIPKGSKYRITCTAGWQENKLIPMKGDVQCFTE